MTVSLDTSVVCPVLVGRAPELEALTRLVDGVRHRAGRPHVVVLAGEAGIGKSRLALEAAALATGCGFQTVQGHCFESDGALPFAPIRDMLRMLMAPRSADDVARDVGPVLPDLAAFFPEFAALLPRQPIAAPPSEPQQQKQRLFQGLAQLFLRLSMPAAEGHPGSPLLLIVEDLHWSDDASLEFLLYLARHCTAAPILLVLTYRSDEVHPALRHFLGGLDREHLAREMTLSRLTPGDVDALIREVFGQSGPIRADFLDAVYGLSEGNPFFIEEILKALLAAGDIFYTYRGWTRKPLSELHIPRTVEDAVQRRMQQVSADARELLTLAAVAGRRFEFSLLQRCTVHDESRLLSLLKELIAAQLMVEESAERLAFRHALTRQAVYARLLARERRILHGTLGATIERGSAQELDRHLADLAYHYTAAENWEKAREYAQRAGDQAQRMHAPRAATEQFSRAIDAARHLGLEPSAALYRARGQAYEQLGDFEATRADYTAAIDAARASHDCRAEWQGLLDLGFLWTGHDYERAGDCLQRALELARTLGDPQTLAQTLNRLGNWYVNIEQPLKGRRYHEEALAIFDTLDDKQGLATTHDLLGSAIYVAGDMRAGAAQYERAATLFRLLDDPRGLASCLSMLMLRGTNYICDTTVCLPMSVADCVADADEVLRITRRIDWRAGEANIQGLLALLLGPRCAYAEAYAGLGRALEIGAEIGHGVVSAVAQFALGALALDLLALPAAQQHLEQALDLATGMRWLFLVGPAAGYLAAAHLAQGEPARAEAVLDAAPGGTAMETQGQRRVWYARAELALARGDAAAALQLTERLIMAGALQPAPPSDPRHLSSVPRLGHLRGMALLGLGRWEEAEVALGAAHAGALAQGLKQLLWRVQADLGRCYHAQGRRGDADEAFAGARRTVEEIAGALTTDEPRGDAFRRHALALLPSPRPPTALQAAKRAFDGLTEREREVAGLIAQGRTNREIAASLVLSQRTVQVHISNIMSKLGYTSRAQVAVWAVGKGLRNGQG